MRHHDETAEPLSPGDPEKDYIDLDPSELVDQHKEFGFAFNEPQVQIAASSSAVRFIKGHPGAGKTTALWLAASLAEGSRALYLTYNSKLALGTEQYFQALGPKSLAVEVLTFEQLPGQLLQKSEAEPLAILSEDEASDEFEEVIAGNYRGVLGPWHERIDELYAELHAYAVGRSLPIPIDALPVSPELVIQKADYIALRSNALGEQGARTAALIATQLQEAGLIEQLFPGPARARRALDSLLNDIRVAERFSTVDLVFVDEVQDLTLVELLLLVRLCATIGTLSGRQAPAFVAAGDEGQTVRASDFEWGRLADLTASQIGRRTEFELLANVRSPQNLGLVVNRSWEMYRQFAKEERPRGHASSTVDDVIPGRIIYTSCRSEDELHEIIEVFDTIPNAALVYPGYRLPQSYKAIAETSPDIVLTSKSAKGLDFQTVGVLDAGRQMVQLRKLAGTAEDEGYLSTLWARTLADHLRVGLSRATENLVLIDVQPDTDMHAEVLSLSKDADCMEMDAEELIGFLRRRDVDAAELALEFCEEVEKLLGDQSMRAYRRAKQAVAIIGDPRDSNSVQDAALRRQVWTLRGAAAADLLNRRNTRQRSQYSVDELISDAVSSFRRAERGTDADAVQLIARFLARTSPSGTLVPEVTRLLVLLPSLDRRIERLVREVLVGWCRDVSGAPIPAARAAQTALIDCVRDLSKELSARHPQLEEYHQRLIFAVATAIRAEGRYQDALELLVQLKTRDHASEGLCHEQLGNHANAAQSYELSGDSLSALRNLRRVPDVAGALRLAQLLNHEDLPVLQWLSRYCDVVGSLQPHVAAKLTDAERRLVAAARDDALLESTSVGSQPEARSDKPTDEKGSA